MEQSVPVEHELGETNQSRLTRVRRRLFHPLGRTSVSTTDFEAIDPLGGILHPCYEEIKEAEANRSFLERILDRLAERRRKANEPNIGTYDTMLLVDDEEMKNLKPPTGKEKEMLEDAADVLVGPPINWDDKPPPLYERRDRH
jgi:hypothetical protein